MVVRPFQNVGSGWEALPVCWERSEGPPGVLGVVRSPSRSVFSGQQSLPQCRMWSTGLPDCREWLACPPGVSRVVGRLSQRVGRGRQALRKCRE